MMEIMSNILSPIVRAACDSGFRFSVKLKVVRSLVILNIMCTFGGFLGLKGWMNEYITFLGFLVGLSIYKSIGRIPYDEELKVATLSLACFFQWTWLGSLIPDIGVMAPLLPQVEELARLLPQVGGLSNLVSHVHILQDGFIVCALIGATLHSLCIWSVNEWLWRPLHMQSSHRCMVMTIIWTIASACFFGGGSMSWLVSMLVVNFTSMVYALAYEYELDTASGVGSKPYSELVFGFLTYGPQKTWKAVVRILFKKLLLAVWNRTGRRVLDRMIGGAG